LGVRDLEDVREGIRNHFRTIAQVIRIFKRSKSRRPSIQSS
jgi:hypothetical protein